MYKRNDKSNFIILNVWYQMKAVQYPTKLIIYTMLLLGLSIVPNILLTSLFFFFWPRRRNTSWIKGQNTQVKVEAQDQS